VTAPEQQLGNLMRDGNFLVAGLVRNCAACLRADVTKLRLALKGVKSLCWLLVESDSEDESTKILAQLSSEIENFHFISLGHLRWEIPQRTSRIAYCRNVYLRELSQNALYKAVDFLIISDFDGVNSLITGEAISTCWKQLGWDVCTANQSGPYYDVWALRHPVWCPNDCWEQLRFLLQFQPSEKALFASVYGKMIRIPSENPWIEVESAYGGLAIYRRSAIQGAMYVGLNDRGEEVCEHVAFHADLRRRGCKLYINPKMINAAWTEHSEQMMVHRRVGRMLKKPFRKHRRTDAD
jgi:hypothetical protein